MAKRIMGICNIHSKKTEKDYIQLHMLEETFVDDGVNKGQLVSIEFVEPGEVEIQGTLAVGVYVRVFKEANEKGFDKVTLIMCEPPAGAKPDSKK